jgi:hypothetical protein
MTSLNTYLRSERRDPAGGLNGVVTLHQVFQALDSTWGCPPNNIHDEAIILERDGDFGWGEYMAEQSNKHPKDIPGRLLGCSTNLFDERH